MNFMNCTRLVTLDTLGDWFCTSWPTWERLVAAVIYYDEQPVYIGSAAMPILDAQHRLDLVAAPKFGSRLPQLNEDYPPGWQTSGRWAMAYLGEFDYPVPIQPLTDDEALALFPSGYQLARLILTGWEMILRFGRQMFVNYHLPTGRFGLQPEHTAVALGYERCDWTWWPESWRQPFPFGQYREGFQSVHTADGEAVWLRAVTLRLDETANGYMIQPWFGDVPNDLDGQGFRLMTGRLLDSSHPIDSTRPTWLDEVNLVSGFRMRAVSAVVSTRIRS